MFYKVPIHDPLISGSNLHKKKTNKPNACKLPVCVLVVSVLQKFHAIRRPIATQLIKIEAVGREATPTEVRRECDARRTRRSSGCITPSILLYRHI